jgi:methylase of polypeptide subunit release factors
MALPDVSRFPSLPDAAWRALGRRLGAIGLTTTYAEPIVAAVQGLAPPLRKPARAWHLRRLREPAGYAMRMLMFQDPVAEEEARAALDALVDPLIEAGALERLDGGRIVSPFVLAVIDDLYVLSDDLGRGGEAVMGLGETTIALCLAALPDRVIDRALDLGCGSGTCALVLAHRARRVVATDVNPRALAMARVNAAINGVTNVELRQGSLFEPVRGEAFDLIASQPPFVPMPDGALGLPAATFLYGGRRGDELALELLGGVAGALTERGRAVLISEWPSYGDEPLPARVRRAVGAAAADVLLLTMPSTSPDEHATSYGAGVHPALDEAFERDVLSRREHLERLGVRGLTPAFTVVERAAAPPGWTEAIEVGPMARSRVSSARIGKILAARSLAGQRERLLEATLRVPDGTVLSEEQDRPGADVPSTIWARFSDEALVQPARMTPDLLGLVTILHESDTARAGLERFAEAYEVPLDAAMERLIPVVEEALRHGLLEVAAPAAPAAP